MRSYGPFRSIVELRPIDLRVFLEVGAGGVSECTFFAERPMKLAWDQGPGRFLLIGWVWATETGRVSSGEQAQSWGVFLEAPSWRACASRR